MVNRRLKKLWGYLLPHWRMVLAGVVALLIVNALGVYIPLLIRDSIDDLQKAFNFGKVWYYVVLILVLSSLMWVSRMLSRIWLFGIGRQIEFDLKQKIFQHLLLLEPSYFATHTSGDLINRATSDVENIRRLVGFAVLSIINTIFAYVLTLPAMFAINIPLSLMAIGVYPLMLITVQLFSKQLRDQQQEVQEKLSDLSELIQEDVSGMALIKIYAQEENERLAFKFKNYRLLNANLKLARTRTLLFPLVEGLSTVGLLILLIFGPKMISSGAITIGDFLALIILVERLVFPTALLGFTISAYQRGEVSIDRVDAIFQVTPNIKDHPNSIVLPREEVKGKITAKNLSYTYAGSATPALKNVNFTIYPGETVAIVGPIGSGKSTLANAIPRLLDIQEGQLFLDGYDITQLRLEDLRGAIAYVPQDSFLFSSTVRNNIRYGDPFKEQPEVEYVAKQVQIHPEILNFPQQYDTLVGERGITLSGGQRQRTALARALLVDAPVLILDDALSSVDNQTATLILNYLSSERGKTVIFISHQLSAAATTDRIFVMDRGQILQMGTHAELIDQPGLYQSLWKQHQLEEILS
ncbi:ABC transporter ATP-binding protein [Gloeothece verrucosa]|uniref:ABC transporter related protein n=1 Tax=Gloeothece verrucosa (strain PCC 7822) TaxID=497965 RepID=E0UG76_GLOV7|nr:ABC transporter ATP-binding protein [Gloeothece verrucosa]ADN15577.1 ABC transporter related protein [Gloeothece verrucosa PCC 7822]